eukprot:GHVR01058566.1.p1 GENE.GHVR01058566.1~~GHVR01058566.1.p1  ORF type:complete len:384 (+),score=78.52 GHVR01058566.1:111-1262(+)
MTTNEENKILLNNIINNNIIDDEKGFKVYRRLYCFILYQILLFFSQILLLLICILKVFNIINIKYTIIFIPTIFILIICLIVLIISFVTTYPYIKYCVNNQITRHGNNNPSVITDLLYELFLLLFSFFIIIIIIIGEVCLSFFLYYKETARSSDITPIFFTIFLIIIFSCGLIYGIFVISRYSHTFFCVSLCGYITLILFYLIYYKIIIKEYYILIYPSIITLFLLFCVRLYTLGNIINILKKSEFIVRFIEAVIICITIIITIFAIYHKEYYKNKYILIECICVCMCLFLILICYMIRCCIELYQTCFVIHEERHSLDERINKNNIIYINTHTHIQNRNNNLVNMTEFSFYSRNCRCIRCRNTHIHTYIHTHTNSQIRIITQ